MRNMMSQGGGGGMGLPGFSGASNTMASPRNLDKEKLKKMRKASKAARKKNR